MNVNKHKAIKCVWKHICNKLGIHAVNGWYKSSDIQKYINYCGEHGFHCRLIDIHIKYDGVGLDFSIILRNNKLQAIM